jgi:hypothetical protein
MVILCVNRAPGVVQVKNVNPCTITLASPMRGPAARRDSHGEWTCMITGTQKRDCLTFLRISWDTQKDSLGEALPKLSLGGSIGDDQRGNSSMAF